MGCSLPGSSNHGILQGLNPGLIPSALVVGLFFITITTWEAPPPSSLYLPQKTNIIIPLCFITSVQFSSVQSNCSVISDSLRPQESQHARPPCPSPTPGVDSNSCPSSRWCHLVLCRPLLLLPPIPPSIRIFSNESTLCIRWPKYWSFSLSISPSNEHPGLVSTWPILKLISVAVSVTE